MEGLLVNQNEGQICELSPSSAVPLNAGADDGFDVRVSSDIYQPGVFIFWMCVVGEWFLFFFPLTFFGSQILQLRFDLREADKAVS